jgi:hypothetical protein
VANIRHLSVTAEMANPIRSGAASGADHPLNRHLDDGVHTRLRMATGVQAGRLVAGQLAAGNFAIYEVVDLRLEIAGLVAVDA